VSSCKWIAPLVLLSMLLVTGEALSNQTFQVSNNQLTSYRIDGATNPTLNLIRGQTYTFNINAAGHPFWIKTVNSTGTANAYNDGVTGNGTDVGTLTFVVPLNAPASLHYNCEFHASMNGAINVSDPVPVQTGTWGKLKHRYVR
jgi:hypothetical protein